MMIIINLVLISGEESHSERYLLRATAVHPGLGELSTPHLHPGPLLETRTGPMPRLRCRQGRARAREGNVAGAWVAFTTMARVNTLPLPRFAFRNQSWRSGYRFTSNNV